MSSKDLYLRLLRYVKPYLAVFVAAIVAIIIVALTEPVLPALMKPLLDGSFVAKDPTYIKLMPLLLIAVFLVRGCASFIGAVAMKWVAQRVVMDLRQEMFNKLLLLPDQRFADSPSGNLLSKFTYDVTQVMQASTNALIVLVRDSLALLGLLAWIFYLNWQLSLIILIVAPSIAIIVRLVSRRLRRLSRSLQTTMGEFNHVIDEVLQGHREIKVFGGTDYERHRFQKVNNWVRRFNMKLAVASEGSVPIVQFLAVFALAFVIYIASQQAALDEITVGGFVSLFGAMAMMLSPIKRLTKLNEQLQRGLAAAESVFALIDEDTERDQGQQKLNQAHGQISFQQVSFRHTNNKIATLHDINLDVKAGETIALVGASGSGKTSLVNLLPRFYDCDSGQILLDGLPIEALRLADLRQQIAYVGQNAVLFNDTVAANISYASDDIDQTALINAATQANALEFINALPQGFDTLIGENGTRLSGGQRQRIAIARALLKNAPILILDEATSALDTESERKVQQALETLRQNRTAFIVAHRLSTIETADRIVVLEQGHIVEIGRHAELLARDGVYAKLYHLSANTPKTYHQRHSTSTG